jgi:20S proteasome alpha/beta subunit
MIISIVYVIFNVIYLLTFDTLSLRTVSASSAAGSETLIGIKGNGFVVLAANTGLSNNGVAYTSTYIDKIHLYQPSSSSSGTTKMTLKEFLEYKRIDRPTNRAKATDGPSESSKIPIGTDYLRPAIPTIAVASVGNYADVDHVTRLIRAEYNLYHYEALTYLSQNNDRNEFEIVDCSIPSHERPIETTTATSFHSVLSVHNVAHIIRNQIANKLRSSTPYNMCTLVAGIVPRQTSIRNNNENNEDTFDSFPRNENEHSVTATTFELAQHIQKQASKLASSTTLPTKQDETNDYDAILYWLDEYGSMIDNIPYGVHGYASDMIYSILDQKYDTQNNSSDSNYSMNLQRTIQLLQDCIQQLQTRYVINTQRNKFIVKYIDPYECIQIEL